MSENAEETQGLRAALAQCEKRLNALFRVASVSGRVRNLNELYPALHKIIAELMYAGNFYLALVDKREGALNFPYFVDEHDEAPEPRPLRSGGLTEYVLDLGEPLLASREDLQRLGDDGTIKLIGELPVDWLGVPLSDGGTTFGVLAVQSYDPVRRFGEQEKDLLEFVSHHIAGAILQQRSQDRVRRLSRAVQQSPISTLIANSGGTVRYANPRIERLTGRAPETFLGQELNEVLGLGKEQRQEVAAAMASGRQWQADLERRRPNGDMYWQSVGVCAIYAEDSTASCEPTDILAIFEDITLRKQAQEELHKATELAEEANRSKSEFLANMSHEIRTPMNAVLGMTGLALETDLDDEQRDYVTLARDSAEALLTLINDILDFSKIEARQLDVEEIDFSLRDCLGHSLKALAFKAEEKGLELALRVEPETPDALIGDPGRLRQVVINLVGNAIKFTGEGEVVLNVGLVESDAKRARLCFEVSDTGIGIPEEKLDMVFGAFSQADASTTRNYGGTGLGLAISRRLIDFMGGAIRVESEVGRGTSFHFEIELPLQDDPRPSPCVGHPRDLSGIRVLIVDDNTTNRLILERTVEAWHMESVCVDSGPAALAVLQEANAGSRPFGLVLLDVQMPEMDGFEVAEEIKDNPDLATTAVAMLTSAGRRGDAKRCREIGVDAYLPKPIIETELWDALHAVFDNRPEGKHLEPLVTRHSLREARSTLSVLLAEDNRVNQKLATRLLEKRGHRVEVAGNGCEAVASWKAGSFDVILMDVQMPEMSGLEATLAIRAEESGADHHIPIVALTAHAMKGDKERCLAAGMDDYLPKPIRPRELHETLERVTSSEVA